MPNYYYTLVDRHSGKCHSQSAAIHIIYDVEGDPLPEIFALLLKHTRSLRYKELISRKELPPQYKPYMHEKQLLKGQLASLYELSERYEVKDIKLAPSCYGCIFERPGQRDHMECNTGCLHDSLLCEVCWEND